MEISGFRLRKTSAPLRIAATCLVIVIAGGYAAALKHMVDHYEGKDERPGLTMDDITGSFHGVKREAGLITALKGSMKKKLPGEERALLLKWLEGSRINEDYDNPDLGENAPAEIIDRNCLVCHSRSSKKGNSIGARVPLEYWDDVKRHAFSRELDSVPFEILVTTTHTHAFGMALVTLAASVLFLATGFSRRVRHTLVMLLFLSLLLDLLSWWLARWSEPFCYLVVAAGALYGFFLAAALAGALFDAWLGKAIGER